MFLRHTPDFRGSYVNTSWRIRKRYLTWIASLICTHGPYQTLTGFVSQENLRIQNVFFKYIYDVKWSIKIYKVYKFIKFLLQNIINGWSFYLWTHWNLCRKHRGPFYLGVKLYVTYLPSLSLTKGLPVTSKDDDSREWGTMFTPNKLTDVLLSQGTYRLN